MYIMNWLSWIILGGLAGWVASMLSKKNAKMGLISNIVVAVIGATVLLWVFNIIQKK